MKKNKLKRLIRREFPETNSSSSHSICIGIDVLDRDQSLEIIDGSILIPGNVNLSRKNLNSFNRALDKIQYICGFLWKLDYDSEDVSEIPVNMITDAGVNVRSKLIEVIKDFTGASEIVFEWEVSKNILFPEVADTGSNRDILDLIFESSDTVKDFIFNPKSYIYISHQETVDIYSSSFVFEDNKGRNRSIIKVHYPEPLGIVDFEIEDLNLNIFPPRHYLQEYNMDRYIDYLLFRSIYLYIDKNGNVVSGIEKDLLDLVFGTTKEEGEAEKYNLYAFPNLYNMEDSGLCLIYTKISDVTLEQRASNGETLDDLEKDGSIILIKMVIESDIFGEIKID